MGVRQILSRIGLAFAAFVTVWPAILFFLWTATLSIKVGNASYPPVFSLSRGSACLSTETGERSGSRPPPPEAPALNPADHKVYFQRSDRGGTH
jgi:hypothetical protein